MSYFKGERFRVNSTTFYSSFFSSSSTLAPESASARASASLATASFSSAASASRSLWISSSS